MAPQRIVVIGAGIIGSVLATRLAQRGARVTLLEGGAVGTGTTSSSFAWIDASHPSLEPYLELSVRGMAAWRELGAEAGGDPRWLSLTGTLTWEREAEPAARLERHMERLRGLGHEVQALDGAAARALEPDLVPDEGPVIWHLPQEGYLQPLAALGDILALGREAGLEVRENARAGGLMREGDRVCGVELAGGERVPADVVVSCLGRFTGDFLAPEGFDVPMVDVHTRPSPAAGLLVLTTPVPARLSRVVVGNGLMMRPDGAGRLLLHSDAHDARVDAGTATMPPPPVAGELVALARAGLRHAQAAEVQSARIGLRSLPVDRKPVVGRIGDGLYVVATHSGITLSPLLAGLVARELLDGEEAGELAPFRPGRFAGAAVAQAG